ncbi:MAG: hypothetical protein JWN56_290 [Sphingobacteriales bacterium]|nr:hypothetical protein [Sphingobacteriales bacterium]
MYPTFINKKRVKIQGIIGKCRLLYFRALGLKVGKNCKIGKIVCDWPNNVELGNNCVVLDDVILGIGYGFNESNTIKIGDSAYIGFRVEFNCTSSIEIGNNVLIATGTKILDVGHNFQIGQIINQQPLTSSPIIIEDDVWIAANCVIVGGVKIGKGSVIGAGSMVNRSVPENEVWAGVPAKFIKHRE